jgi:hypothetical protein
MSGGNNCIFSMDKETKKPDLELIAKCIGATGDSDKINWFLNPDNFPYLEERLSKTEWRGAFIQPLAKASAEQSHIDLFKSLKVSKEDHLKECLIKACTHEQTAIINHIVKAEPDFLKKSETVHAALEANGCIQVFFDNYSYSEAAKHQLLDYALDHGSLASCQYLAAQVQDINAVDQTTIVTLCELTTDHHLNYIDGKQKPSARKLYSLVENGLDLENLPAEFRPKYQKYAEWINMHGSTVEDIPLHLTEYSPHYFKPKAYEFVKKQLGFEHSVSDLTARENMAYQISALFQTEDRILSYMEKWGKLGYTLHDISQMISIPAQGQFNAKSWGDATLKQGPRMANLLRFADRMSEPLKNDAGTTWSYKNTLNAIGGDLYNRAKEHTKLAELCANCLYTEADFEKTLEFWNQYQELYKDSDYKKEGQTIPAIEIDGDEFGKAGYIFRKLDDGDVRGLLLGAFTECCQHIANPHGHSCAEHGFIKETSGFYVIEDKDTNQIIGQSWAWRGKKDELTLDSLEFINGALNAQNWQSLCTIFTQKIAECDELNNISAVHIGCGGKTPALSFDHASKSTLASPKEPCAYSDAKGNQYRINIPRNAL